MTQRRASGRKPPFDVAARIAEGMGYCDLASHYGVNYRTARQWGEAPEVAEEVSRIVSDLRDSAKLRLVGVMKSALDVVEEILLDTDAPAAARVRAAELCLTRVLGPAKPDGEALVTPPISPAADLTTPEGQEQLVAELRALPRHILARAMEAA